MLNQGWPPVKVEIAGGRPKTNLKIMRTTNLTMFLLAAMSLVVTMNVSGQRQGRHENSL